LTIESGQCDVSQSVRALDDYLLATGACNRGFAHPDIIPEYEDNLSELIACRPVYESSAQGCTQQVSIEANLGKSL